MKIVHTADCHLKDRTWQSRPEISGDAMASFQQIIQFCIDNPDVFMLAIAGDLFDSAYPSDLEVLRYITLLQTLPPRVTVAVSCGNHDLPAQAGGWSMLARLNHVISVDQVCSNGQSFKVGPVRIYGWDFVPRTRLAEKLAGIPDDAQFILAHLMLKEVTGGLITPDCSVADLPIRKVGDPGTIADRLYLLGDYHHPSTAPIDHRNSAIYPGSTYMTAIDEPPEKYFVVIDVDPDGGIQAVSTQQLRTRPFRRLSIQTASDLEEVKSRTGPTIKNEMVSTGILGLVHVHYVPVADAYQTLQEVFSKDWCYLVLTPHPIEVPTLEPTAAAETASMAEVLEHAMEGYDEKLKKMTTELIDADLAQAEPVIDSWEVAAGLRGAPA